MKLLQTLILLFCLGACSLGFNSVSDLNTLYQTDTDFKTRVTGQNYALRIPNGQIKPYSIAYHVLYHRGWYARYGYNKQALDSAFRGVVRFNGNYIQNQNPVTINYSASVDTLACYFPFINHIHGEDSTVIHSPYENNKLTRYTPSISPVRTRTGTKVFFENSIQYAYFFQKMGLKPIYQEDSLSIRLSWKDNYKRQSDLGAYLFTVNSIRINKVDDTRSQYIHKRYDFSIHGNIINKYSNEMMVFNSEVKDLYTYSDRLFASRFEVRPNYREYILEIAKNKEYKLLHRSFNKPISDNKDALLTNEFSKKLINRAIMFNKQYARSAFQISLFDYFDINKL